MKKLKAIPLQHIYISIFLFLICISLSAQHDSIRYSVKLSGLSSTGNFAPFWLQSNTYGIVPSSSNSFGMLLGIGKPMQHPQNLFDYGFNVSGLTTVGGGNSEISLHEYYARARLSVFHAVVGAREEYYGMQDSSLSCGGFLFSRNARPMPKIYAGIEHYVPVPFTHRYLEIKGGISHGWFNDNIYSKGLMLHHKYAYLRLGGKLPVHVQYGVDHVVQWGGYEPNYGQQPNDFKSFLSVFLGKSGGTGGEMINKLGNHIIGQSLGLDASLADFRLSAYWQIVMEDGPLRLIGSTTNSADGLWGISLRNNKMKYINGFVYEYLQTSDQSGPFHDKDGVVYGGVDSYFYNYIYQNGWTYNHRTIGTPFISSPFYKNGFLVWNNRVVVHHTGIEGNIAGYNYKAMASFSKNYGRYYSPININQSSLLLDVRKDFNCLHGIELGLSAGADIGQLYGKSSVGVMISVRKTGNILRW